MNRSAHSKRFYTALTVSCLLHALLAYMPQIGATTADFRSVMQGGHKPRGGHILNATLLMEKGAVAIVAEHSALEASAADSPDHRMANEKSNLSQVRALGVGLLAIPEPIYYTTDQLTKRPQPISAPKLDVPEMGTIPFSSGMVILKLWINEVGAVVSVDLEKRDLPIAISRSAVAAFGNLRFVPGEINGRRVRTMMRIEVTYDDGPQLSPLTGLKS
jgi:hypothetical protein